MPFVLSVRAWRFVVVFAAACAALLATVPGLAFAAAPTVAPTGLAPDGGASVPQNPVLSWSAVPGAATYRVQVSTTNTFGSTVYTASTANTSATPTDQLPAGQLFWRVAAADSSSAVGPWSATATFNRTFSDAPALVAPDDAAVLTYPADPLLFRWAALTGAKTYTFQIANNPDFVSPTSATTANTSYTLTEPLTVNQTWYWRVQGTNGTLNSPWSSVRSFSVNWPSTPTPISPVNATVTDVVLSWSPVAGAATYEVQVNSNPDFTNNMIDDQTVKGTHYSPAATYDNGSYYWRVRARDSRTTPNLGSWSAVVQFQRAWPDQPVLQSPADGAVNVTVPTLQWSAAAHAAYYQVEFSTDPNFTPGPTTTYECYTDATTFTPYGLFGAGSAPVPGACGVTETVAHVSGLYYWHVRGIDDGPGNGSVNGIWSTPRSFSLVVPSTPDVISPTGGVTVTVPVLHWASVPGVDRYKVTVLKNGTAVPGTPVITYGTSWSPTTSGMTAGTPGTAYQWYVQTVYNDSNNSTGPAPTAANYGSFTLTDITSSGSTPDPLAVDTSGVPVGAAPAMSWAPVTGATYYLAYYAPAGTSTWTVFGANPTTPYKIPYPGFTYPNLLGSGSYDWYVEAWNSSGLISSSAAGSFTIGQLSVATPTGPANCASLSSCPTIAETPTLTWNVVPGAGAYIVYLAADPNFTNIVRTYATQWNSLTPRESLKDSQAGNAYYWFVRPCKAVNEIAGTASNCGVFDNSVFSNAFAFRKFSPKVALDTPADGTQAVFSGTDANDGIFRWNDYLTSTQAAGANQEAKSYRLQVSTTQDFTNIIDDVTVDQTSYAPWSKTYPVGPLYWRVAATDGSDNLLTFSDARVVFKSVPNLPIQNPVSGSTVQGLPYFQWAPQLFAVKYNVEVYKNADTTYSTSNKVANATTKVAAWAPTSALPSGTYAWRVQRLDADGLQGPWTDGGTFTIALPAPVLASPANGSFTGSNLVFSWNPVAGAVAYMFEASTSTSFTPALDSVTTSAANWAPTKAYPDGTIYWRVKALDAAGNVQSTSSTSSIRRDATPPTATLASPATGVGLSGPFAVSFSEPVTGVDGSSFTVSASGTRVPGAVTVTSSTAATFAPSVRLVPGQTYTVSVGAPVQDAAGNPLVPFSTSARATTVVDNTSPALVEMWDRDTSTSAIGHGYSASLTGGSALTWSFTGTSTSLVGRTAADGGYAAIYVDGAKKKTVSFYSASTRWKRTLFSLKGLAAKRHTVRVRVLGTHPRGSHGNWVYVDAFKVGSTTVDDKSGAVVNSFRRVASSAAAGKSYDITSHVAKGDNGSRPGYKVVVRGTSLSLSMVKSSSSGKATVYVDGRAKATIDLYSSVTKPGVVWSIKGLSNALHTVQVLATGARNTKSHGTNVALDVLNVG